VFQIRNPVLFLTLGSRKGKNQDQGLGILDKYVVVHFSESLSQFGVAEPDPGSGMEKLIRELR
jgi:hypothetical protein